MGNGMLFTRGGDHLDFGNQQHWCFGNLDRCTDGHVLSFWIYLYESARPDREYIVSSGANALNSAGLAVFTLFNSFESRHYLHVNYIRHSLVTMGPTIRVRCTSWHVRYPIQRSSMVQVIIQWLPQDNLYLFLNGQQVTSGPPTQSSPCTHDTQDFVIGKRNDRTYFVDCGYFWLDEFKFFDRALTEEEIQELNKKPTYWLV